MIWIPGGEFTMGSDDQSSRRNEQPPHRVKMDGFWMDEHVVTNEEFEKFVKATGYLTTAERKPSWEELKKQLPPGTPKPDDSVLVAGSMVFTPSSGPVDLNEMQNFWRWVPGANWRHPEGPDSDLKGREKHPVVQVSWDDAVAYAKWAGKRLPTEAEWEFAARGGLDKKRFAWGDEFKPNGKFMANVWEGEFPYKNTAEDGFARTSPVKSFPANGYGLYDVAGNVWQWCSDWYRPDTFAQRAGDALCANPTGPLKSWSPNHPYQEEHVTKGGSFLCHVSYCESYRPSARRGTPADTGMSHIGFRCVKSAEQRAQLSADRNSKTKTNKSMKATIIRNAALSLLAMWTLGIVAHAAELSGATLPDTLSAGDATLKLNGLGLRKKAIVKVYVGALYLTSPSKDANAILASDQAKAIRLHFLRDLKKAQLVEAFQEGFEGNAKDKAGQKAAFEKMLALVPDVKEGETLTFTYVPGKGTTLQVGNKNLGSFEGKGFADAVFSIWLGPKPPTADLKKGMLG